MVESVEAALGGLALLIERKEGKALLAEIQAGRRSLEELNLWEQRFLIVAGIDGAWERCRQVRYEDPEEMVSCAKTALEAAEALTRIPKPSPSEPGLLAVAWAELANAYRVADDLAQAEAALAQAQARALRPGVPPEAQRRVAEVLASQRKDQRRFSEAAEILECLVKDYSLWLPDREQANLLVQLAIIHSDNQRPKAAIQKFAEALPFVPEGDPLLLSLIQGLALSLVDVGKPEAADKVLERSRELYRRIGSLNEIRLTWLEAKVALALDQPTKAEAKLNLASREFLLRKRPYDSALVSLDLALLLVRQGRRAELAALVEQMLATFRRLGIAREWLASLILLKTSCEAGASKERLRGQIELLAHLLPELERKSKRKSRP